MISLKSSKKIIQKIQSSPRLRLKTCLWFGCHKPTVSCHTSARKNLKHIASNNLVFCPQNDYFKISKNPIDKSGIKLASTFYGFCKDHDCHLFESIENRDIVEIDDKAAYLLFMRTIFYEYHQKFEAYVRLRLTAKYCKQLGENPDPSYWDYCRGLKRFLRFDFPFYQEKLFLQDPSQIKYLWKRVEKNVRISASCMINPEFNRFSLRESPQVSFSFNIIPYKKYTLFIICWLSEHDYAMNEIELQWNTDFNKLVNHLIFNESSDYYLSPLLWEKLDKAVKGRMMEALFNRSSGYNMDFNIIN